MNGKSKAWAIALLSVVLILGGVAGASIDRVVSGREAAAADDRRGGDRDRRGRYMDYLSAELALTEAQRAQVELIVDRHREQVSTLWKQMRPHFEESRNQLRAEIREVLTEEQQAAYQALLDRESEHRHRKRGNGNKGRDKS